jgi:hypothetical protein
MSSIMAELIENIDFYDQSRRVTVVGNFLLAL